MALAVVIGFVERGSAQEAPSVEAAPSSASELPLDRLADAPPSRSLSRDEAMALAAERNYSVLIQGLQRQIVQESALASRATFVPSLRLDASYRDRADGAALPPLRETRMGGEVAWRTPIGTALSVGLTANQRASSALNPFNSALLLSVSQSLLRGGWEAGAFTPALEADLAVELQRELFREALNSLLVDVEAAYWELAFAQADVQGRLRSLGRAQRQFDDTRENIARGLLADADIFIVEENLVIFEQQLLGAREALALARSRLALLLQMNPREVVLEASDPLEEVEAPLPGQDEALGVALQESPTLGASRRRVRLANVRLAFEENLLLPTLDLDASLALNGAGEEFGDPWGAVGAADEPDLRVGIVFEMPLSFGPRRARVEREALQVRSRLLSLKDDETRLRYQVQDLLINLEAQQRRLVLTSRRVSLARSKLEAQMEKYRNGISTLDEVVRFQRDLDTALIVERRVRVNLLVGLSRLKSAQGVLHRAHGIEVE